MKHFVLYVAVTLVAGSILAGSVRAVSASWIPIGPTGTDVEVRSVSVAPSDHSVLYLGTYYSAGAMLFRSVDAGGTWSPEDTGLPPGGEVDAIAAHPSDANIVYAGAAGGVFKSLDGGNSWASQGMDGLLVESLALDPANSSTAYAGAQNAGVFKTTDAGAHWNPTGVIDTSSPTFEVHAVVVDPLNSSLLYVGTSPGGVFKSSNAGGTWVPASNIGGVYGMVIHPLTPSILYAGTDAGVLKSTNGGSTWVLSGDGIPGGFAVYALAVDPANSAILYAGTDDDVFRSADGGATWSPMGLTGHSINALAIDPGNTATVYAATSYLGTTPSAALFKFQASASTTTTTTLVPGGSTSTSTTIPTASSTTTTTTLPCGDTGFAGVRCLLDGASDPVACGAETIPPTIARRIAQAVNLIDRGGVASNPKKARGFARKAAKTLKRAAGLAVTAASKGKLSTACGDALSTILREAEQRAEQLAATL